MHEVDHLDLVELVDAQHAARHLAGAARLAAEARRVGRELDGRLGRDLRAVSLTGDSGVIFGRFTPSKMSSR